MNNIHRTNIKCHDCEFVGAEDFFRLRDFGNNDIAYICDDCIAKYPKDDPRDWRPRQPYAQRGHKITLGEVLVPLFVVVCLAVFGIGLSLAMEAK